MNGGNNSQQQLRDEIANILPQHGGGSTPPPVSKPAPAPTPKPQPAPPVRGEDEANQKYILRTMPSDLDSLKKGENPSGLNIEKSGKTQARPSAPLSPPPKLELGKMEKAPTMAPPSSPAPKPSSPPPNIPDLGTLPPKSGGTPPPPASLPPKPATPPPAAPIEEPKKKSNLLGIIIVVLGLGILTYAGVWYFVIRDDASPTPTPTPTSTPTQVPLSDLEQLFGVADPITISSASSLDPRTQLVQAMDSQLVGLNEPRPFVVVNDNGIPYDFVTLMNLVGVEVPVDLSGTLDIDEFVFIIYGQTEEFDENGNLILTTGSSARFKRIGLVVKSDLPENTATAMRVWEPTMMLEIEAFFQLAGNNPETSSFNDNVYNGVDVRYINYPSPDLSIDWAVASSSTGENFLVLTNSREAIFGIVDNLLGFLAE